MKETTKLKITSWSAFAVGAAIGSGTIVILIRKFDTHLKK